MTSEPQNSISKVAAGSGENAQVSCTQAMMTTQHRRSARMQQIIIRRYLRTPKSRKEILREYCSGKRVLDIGCVQHNADQASNDSWLHKSIVDMAAYTLGVDYLPDAVAQLSERGYNVIVGDVNHRLPIEDTFDVIVVGNLIEHLSNFEGLLLNLQRLLTPGGVALISTANPFFREQYFYSAFKNTVIVNQEHTCWIDPITLDQLCSRFSLETTDVRWVREKWRLSDAIFHDERRTLDNFSGKWIFHSRPSLMERVLSPALLTVVTLLAGREKKLKLKLQYSDLLPRYLYLKALGMIVEAYWRLRRLSIPSSAINEYELFVSVVRRSEQRFDVEGADSHARGSSI